MATTERVPIGTPITTGQAARAILRMVRSPMMGDIEKDRNPGSTLRRLHDSGAYLALSGGEKHLVDIAQGIWSPHAEVGQISDLGGLDKDNRRKVLLVLFYLHLGSDVDPSDLAVDEFKAMFE